MKQATNPFAPVPLWRRRLPGYAAMGAATIAMAVGLIAMQNARTTVAGTLLPVSEADAATYGISAVYQLDDGSYRVEGVQKGFQSDVQAAVTIDAEGNVSAVEILSQAETDSLGGQCVDSGVHVPVPGRGSLYAGRQELHRDRPGHRRSLCSSRCIRCVRCGTGFRPRTVERVRHLSRGGGHPQDVCGGADPLGPERTSLWTTSCRPRWIPAPRPWHAGSCTLRA